MHGCLFFTVRGCTICQCSTILNKHLQLPNKCPPQSVIDHLHLSFPPFPFVLPRILSSQHEMTPQVLPKLPLTHQTNCSFTFLSGSAASLFPYCHPSLDCIPENWTHSSWSLRHNGIFSLTSPLILSASLNPRERIIN